METHSYSVCNHKLDYLVGEVAFTTLLDGKRTNKTELQTALLLENNEMERFIGTLPLMGYTKETDADYIHMMLACLCGYANAKQSTGRG